MGEALTQIASRCTLSHRPRRSAWIVRPRNARKHAPISRPLNRTPGRNDAQVGIDTDGRRTLATGCQPPLGVELMRVLAPHVRFPARAHKR